MSESEILPLGVAEQSRWLYVRSRRDSDCWALYRYHPESDEWSQPLFDHSEFDVEGPLVYSSSARGEPVRAIGVRHTSEHRRVHWLDPKW